jgi:hypothetical protein
MPLSSPNYLAIRGMGQTLLVLGLLYYIVSILRYFSSCTTSTAQFLEEPSASAPGLAQLLKGKYRGRYLS